MSEIPMCEGSVKDASSQDWASLLDVEKCKTRPRQRKAHRFSSVIFGERRGIWGAERVSWGRRRGWSASVIILKMLEMNDYRKKKDFF